MAFLSNMIFYVHKWLPAFVDYGRITNRQEKEIPCTNEHAHYFCAS